MADFICSICGKKFSNKYSLGSHLGHYKSGKRNSVLKVKREIRKCACGCGKTFECKITSSKKYYHGHNKKGKKYTAREKRYCNCGCGESFICKVTSKKVYIKGHIKKIQNEVRSCKCGCEETFRCKINNNQKYIRGHQNKNRKFNNRKLKVKTSLSLKVLSILEGKEKAPLCSCGCGNRVKVKKHHSWSGIPKYIHGHHNKGCVSEKKGKSYDDMYGGEKSIKIKSKQGVSGDKNPSKNPEVVEKISNKAKLRWKNEDFRKRMSEIFNSKEYIEKHSGKNSPVWKGGISFEPYTPKFNNVLKEKIRDRDSRICQICGKTEEENGKKLPIHHINYNKKDVREYNLISLCNSCHSKTNYNRFYWRVYITTLLNLLRSSYVLK